MGLIYKKIADLSWDEKYEWVTTRKIRAGALFRSNQAEEAL